MTDRPQSKSVARSEDKEPIEDAGGGAAPGSSVGERAEGRRAVGACWPCERSSVPA